jgi:xylulokinase
VGLGRIRFDDIPGLVSHTAAYQPQQQHRAFYDDLYAEFLNLYKRTRGIMARLNRAVQ